MNNHVPAQQFEKRAYNNQRFGLNRMFPLLAASDMTFTLLYSFYENRGNDHAWNAHR